MNDPFELPSLEEIEQIKRQRSQAIEALEISGNSVKCQRCGITVPIVGKLSRPHNYRVVILQQIKWMENYYHGVSNINDLKQLNKNFQNCWQKMQNTISSEVYLCIAAELLVLSLCVLAAMMRPIC